MILTYRQNKVNEGLLIYSQLTTKNVFFSMPAGSSVVMVTDQRNHILRVRFIQPIIGD